MSAKYNFSFKLAIQNELKKRKYNLNRKFNTKNALRLFKLNFLDKTFSGFQTLSQLQNSVQSCSKMRIYFFVEMWVVGLILLTVEN